MIALSVANSHALNIESCYVHCADVWRLSVFKRDEKSNAHGVFRMPLHIAVPRNRLQADLFSQEVLLHIPEKFSGAF